LPSALADGKAFKKLGFSQTIKRKILVALAQIMLKRQGNYFTEIRLKPYKNCLCPSAKVDGNS
jgi:hypothetical protein